MEIIEIENYRFVVFLYPISDIILIIKMLPPSVLFVVIIIYHFGVLYFLFILFYFESNGLKLANTAVIPEVAIEILKNLSKGENAFKPELSTVGGSSWFITEGNPYTGISPDKNINILAEVVEPIEKLVFDEQLLIHRRDVIKIEMEPDFKIKFTEDRGITEFQITGDTKKSYLRQLKRASERRMWEKVDELVRTSESKVGEVVLKGSAFSKGGDGKFAVVADASKIKVKGGITALTEIVNSKGIAVEPVIIEAAEAMATKLMWVGRVQKVFRYGGKVLIVVGIASDVYKVYIAEDKVKAVVESATR